MKSSFVSNQGQLFNVTEFCELGDMHSWIAQNCWQEDEGTSSGKTPMHMPADQILTWWTQLALAFEHTHNQKRIHRNFCSSHVLLQHVEGDKPKVVLMNFGNVQSQENDPMTRSTQAFAGNIYYVSPENADAALDIMQGNVAQGYKPGKKQEVWALGQFLIELCYCRRASDIDEVDSESMKASNEARQAALQSVLKKYPNFEEIFQKTLVENPEERPSILEIIVDTPIIANKVHQIVTSNSFREEFCERTLKRIQLGWATAEDIERVRHLMTEIGQNPDDMNNNDIGKIVQLGEEGGQIDKTMMPVLINRLYEIYVKRVTTGEDYFATM